MHASDVFSVAGRVSIVTGASVGLGERFARVLAENGARVLAVARRIDPLHDLAARYPNVVAHQADLTDEIQRASIIDATLERFGRVDVLVNNAGYGVPQAAIDEPMDDFRRVFELNLMALFDLSRLAAKPMIEQSSGSIINVASILGLVSASPIPNASYAASKGAVVHLTRELGCQWARTGVRVNAIAPGYFPSESAGSLEPGTTFADFIHRTTPMGRPGKEHELDGVLLYLCSDASTYTTGQTMVVDGGWTAK